MIGHRHGMRAAPRNVGVIALLTIVALTACTSPGTISTTPETSAGTASAGSTPELSASESTSAEAPAATPIATTADSTSTSPSPLTTPSPTVSTQPTNTRVQVDVTLTYSSADSEALEAAGFAAVKADGTCTLEVTWNGGVTSVSGPSYEDATTTSCGTLSVPIEQLGAEPWTIRLGYLADEYEGWSEPIEVTP